MKIYFAASIRGGRDMAHVYPAIVEMLTDMGHQVLSELFADQKLTAHGSHGTSREIWEKDIMWVKEADAIVAEVTNPSLGVGYEIAKAEEWGKRVICLYQPQEGKRLSAMIGGSPQVTVIEYRSVSDVAKQLHAALGA